jgi:hypothetical protein
MYWRYFTLFYEIKREKWLVVLVVGVIRKKKPILLCLALRFSFENKFSEMAMLQA